MVRFFSPFWRQSPPPEERVLAALTGWTCSVFSIIDNYIDDSVLLMLAKRVDGVTAEIVTRRITETLSLDVERHNLQYPPVTTRECDRFHDRFLIIDDTVYHLGASLKDLGKKLFAFSRMEIGAEVFSA